MKKTIALLIGVCMVTAGLAGCSNSEPGGMTGNIVVVSREDGSGTRGAFIEITGVEQKDDSGEKIDMTTPEAEITNSTAVMMTTIAQSTNAIGYISLGSLNDTVKALDIDGIPASADHVKDTTYPISRPFHIVTPNGAENAAADDFITFMMSEQGQAIVEENGYVSEGNSGAYETSGASGRVVVAGSSSVTPVMEKLKEAYGALNSDVSIEVQQSDSTTGATSAIEGICDIGMLSRNLKDSEVEAGLEASVIALDGIAVIVNPESTIDSLTTEQVKQIFTGEITSWDGL